MKTMLNNTAVALTGALLWGGCAAEVLDSDSDVAASGQDSASEMGTVEGLSSALRSTAVEEFWYQGERDRKLALFSTHVCVLAHVRGEFNGGGEEVWVTRRGDWWVVGGKSSQSHLRAGGLCYRRDEFTDVAFPAAEAIPGAVSLVASPPARAGRSSS